MENQADKANAKLDQATGTVKDNVGGAVGNDEMQGRGKAQHAEGEVEEMTANVEHFLKGIKDKTEGALKGIVNSITGK
ncbi:hypothetical protein BDC45DRAFT_493298 [Circinella umbellata]|nr:hypothetical protein BDC45DRAFT_493298 [Circinella umbellata]